MKMTTNPEVRVTLSTPMWMHLRREAARLEVPMELLIAGLVCDTIEVFPDSSIAVPRSASRPGEPGLTPCFSMAS
jgi:hypothetical protein